MRKLTILAFALLISQAQAQSVPNALVAGYTTYFATETCPEGWVQLPSAEGRLIVSTTNSSNAGVTVNSPLASQEVREHSHTYSTTYSLANREASAIGRGNTAAAHDGTFGVSGTSQSMPTGYPFTQLPLCRYTGTSSETPFVGFGSIALFSADVQGCPSTWTPKQDVNGRIMVPGFNEGGPQPSPASPLQSGEDRKHSHQYSSGFIPRKTDFVGIGGCCDHEPAGDAPVTFGGQTDEVSTGLPYLQMQTCVNTYQSFNTSMPNGALVFNELSCPPDWELVTLINGRMLVGLPANGVPGASFGGDSFRSISPTDPTHHHVIAGSITPPDAHVLLASGCCDKGYAKSGTYLYSTPSQDVAADLPYTLMPMCQQSSNVARNKAFFDRAERKAAEELAAAQRRL